MFLGGRLGAFLGVISFWGHQGGFFGMVKRIFGGRSGYFWGGMKRVFGGAIKGICDGSLGERGASGTF